MQNEIFFREIQESDRTDFYNLVHAFYQTDAVSEPIPQAHYRKTFSFILEHRNLANAYLVFKASELIGYVQVSFMFSNEAGGKVLWIEELYIVDAYQGQGIGQVVFSFLEGQYQDDIKRIRLEVDLDNEAAIKLYEREGFQTLDYIPFYKDKE